MGKKSREKRSRRDRKAGQLERGQVPWPKRYLEALMMVHRFELDMIEEKLAKTPASKRGTDSSVGTPWPETVYVPSIYIAWAANRAMLAKTPEEWLPGGEPTQEWYEMFRSFQPVAELLAGYAAWRASQGVYMFEKTFGRHLQAMPLEGEMPTDVLRRLPEWCVYFELTMQREGFEDLDLGALAYYDTREIRSDSSPDGSGFEIVECIVIKPVVLVQGASLLNLVDLLEMSLRKEIVIPLLDGLSVGECIKRGINDRYSNQVIGEGAPEVRKSLLNAVLYLCSEEPDVSANGEPRGTNGERVVGLSRMPLRVWDVGVRLGAELSKAAEEEGEGADSNEGRGSGERPRAHLRRAHWHGYWTGPRSGVRERNFKMKWLKPVLVNAANSDKITTMVRRVEGKAA